MKGGRITSIGQLRPKVSVEDELEWFFNRAESDMGAQSNFHAMVAGYPTRENTADDAVEACRRHRRIRAWLKTIADSDAGVLQCAYELRAWPVALYDALGRLTGIVVRLACALDHWPGDRSAQQAVEMARARWLLAQSLSPTNATLVRLRRDASVRLIRAQTAYSRVRTQGSAQ